MSTAGDAASTSTASSMSDASWRGAGCHHAGAENVVGDALRQNALVLDGAVVLRLPLLGLRLQPGEFFQQIADALAPGRRRAA